MDYDFCYEEDFSFNPPIDYVHVSEIDDVDSAKNFLEDVLEGLYGDASLEKMESALAEVCAYLNVPIPQRDLKVTKSNEYFKLGAELARLNNSL